MDRIQQSVNEYNGVCSCAQSILTTFGAEFKIDRALAMRLASAFGSGMGNGRGLCGAVTGAMMVLGLHFGTPDEDADDNGEQNAHEAVSFFIRNFIQHNGSVICYELLSNDLSEGEEAPARDRCPKFVRDAAEILEMMLHTGAIN